MHHHHGQLGPPLTLAERLEQLNDNLQEMGDRLKEAIAAAIGTTVADAVRDTVHNLLGGEDRGLPQHRDSWEDDNYRGGRRAWDEPDDPWREPDPYDPQPLRRSVSPRRVGSNRWGQALTAALQTSLWWLREQKSRRPVLATSAVALAAGVTAFFYGPALAAGVGVLASVVSLVLTTEGARSATEQLATMSSG